MTLTTLDLQRIGANDLILTPNRRLSAWLQRDCNELMLGSGKRAWNSLKAMPVDSWLLEQYDALALIHTGDNPLPRLLSPQQSRLIWQKHLARNMEEGTDREGMVQLCIQARSLACRWQLRNEDWNQGETEENRVFACTHEAYLAELQAQNWVDAAGLAALLLRESHNHLKSYDRVFLHGFNDLSEPQLISIGKLFERHGASVHFSGAATHPLNANTICLPDHQLQFKQALLWAINQYQNNPQGLFAIVIPNLQQQRSHLEKLCHDLAHANPGSLPAAWQNAINITAGRPLSSYPIISHLQLLLRAMHNTLLLNEWAVLIKSPFVKGGIRQFELRDSFVCWLRSNNRPQLSWLQVQQQWHAFNSGRGENQEQSEAPLSLADASLSQVRFKKSVSQWLQWLQQTLKQLGWLSEFTLDSETYQVNQRLQETLQSMVELEGFLDNLSFSDFTQELFTQLKNTTFQPQTDTAPIQIMGVLEAASLNFDGLWVCECESQQWPQAATSNPALPRQTLRKYNMPGSGPDRELQYAKSILEGFRRCAPQVVFSWGQFQGDSQLLLSPLLEDLPATNAQATSLNAQSREQRLYEHRSAVLSVAADEVGVPLSETHSKGGSGLIKAQSLCPFKAYAEYRLGIKQEDDLQDGVKASDRGTLVHRVLEAFWEHVENYSALQHLLSNELRLSEFLHELIEKELIRFKQDVFLQPEALYALERERTFNAVSQWLLSAESSRSNFVVDKLEKRQKISLAGLELSLTADRIDVLEDGSRIIIDYKTGLKTTSSLLGERPEEPQLPLYALLDPTNTTGIYFGIVRPDKAEWHGLQSTTTAFSASALRTVKIPEEGWEEQVSAWKLSLEAIAIEYQQGVARVAPLSDSVCQFCHLGPVCRIKEHNHDDE